MAFENLLTSLENGIYTITINRPDRLNALNRKTITEIGEAFSEVYSSKDIRGVIITGAGEKAFAAGADISEFTGVDRIKGAEMASAGQEVFNLVENCPKPVVAAVNGFALGGGCELSMACHLRIASENARFGQPEAKLGLIPGYGGTQRLIQLIGKTKAMELLMTCEMIGADEALRLGLVNYTSTQDKLIPACRELLGKILQQSPMAVTGIINAVNAYYQTDINGFKAEIDEFGKCCETEDFAEGTRAFLEKRKANFQGK
jgi:enoyl-CoA hydratase